MTLSDSLAVAVDALRELLPHDAKAQKAAKVLEEKRAVLRLKAETRAASKNANLESIRSAELRLTVREIRHVFLGTICPCGRTKAESTGFGLCCWNKISPETRHAMHALRLGQGWEQAFELGLAELRLPHFPEIFPPTNPTSA